MNEDEVRQLYHTAWAHWGAEAQVDMLIEEMAELTQALLKSRRCDAVFSKAVFDELADVSICMDQMIKKLEEMGREDAVDDRVEYKLKRLKERLMKSMGKKYPVQVGEITP